MKLYKFLIIVLLFVVSCNIKSNDSKETDESVQIIIPYVEKNIEDEGLKLKNGILYYLENPYSGTIKAFYQKGNIKSISTYYKGKREGKYIGFYPNQKKWFERYYSNGIKVNSHKGWYQNGQSMFEYQFNQKGLYNGFIKDWHANGQLAKHFNFKEGKEVGSQKMWQPSGKIKSNFYTVNGERHGLIGLKNCVSVLTNENE